MESSQQERIDEHGEGNDDDDDDDHQHDDDHYPNEQDETIIKDCDNDTTTKTTTSTTTQVVVQYNPRKPKWWKNLSRGKPTKGQKRSIRRVMTNISAEGMKDENGKEKEEVRSNSNINISNESNSGSSSSIPTTTTTTTTATATTDRMSLALPDVPYGEKIDWNNTDVFGNLDTTICSDNNDNGNRDNNDLDIWLELGFGRGENLLALLHQNALKEEAETVQQSDQHQEQHQRKSRRPFRLVGSEIHSPGIGYLCQRICETWDRWEELEQEQQQAQQHQQQQDGGNSSIMTTTSTLKNTMTEERSLIDQIYWTDYTVYSSEINPYSISTNSTLDNSSTPETATSILPSSGTANVLKSSSVDVPDENQDHQFSSSSSYHRCRTPPYSNLRIYGGDGYKLLPKIPDNSLAAVLVTFPDPFPKKEEQQWRLIQVKTVMEFHRVLRKPSKPTTTTTSVPAGLFYLATDHDGYYEWSHHIVSKVNNELSNKKPIFEEVLPCPDRMNWLPAVSTYEQKGWKEGRSTKLSCWRALDG